MRANLTHPNLLRLPSALLCAFILAIATPEAGNADSFIIQQGPSGTVGCTQTSSGTYCPGGSSGNDDSYSPPAYRGPTAFEIEQQRRAAAWALQQRRASEINDKGIECAAAGDDNCALNYHEQASRLWPGNKTFLANIAATRANIAYKGSKLEEALRYLRGAVEYYRDARTTCGEKSCVSVWSGQIAQVEAELLAYRAGNYKGAIAKMREAISYQSNDNRQNTLREWQLRADEAERAQREAKATEAREAQARANVRQDLSSLVTTLPGNQSSGGTVPGRQGSPTFGINPNPPSLQFMPAAPPADVKSKSALEQLANLNKDSTTAKDAKSDEQAKRQAGCGTADNPCQKGEAPAPVTITGVPRGSARLPAEVLTKMRADENGKGKQLIDAETKARTDVAAAKTKLDAIDKAIAAAKDADKPSLGAIQQPLYQDWSNKTNIANDAAGAIEEEAENKYGVNFNEVPGSAAPKKSRATPRQ